MIIISSIPCLTSVASLDKHLRILYKSSELNYVSKNPLKENQHLDRFDSVCISIMRAVGVLLVSVSVPSSYRWPSVLYPLSHQGPNPLRRRRSVEVIVSQDQGS